jgi:Ca-activated chloride channel family protein
MDESQLATEQWLRRIPDDPGGLLRRKFQYLYQQRSRENQQETRPW